MAAVIASLTPQQWEAASPCEGWTARDVLAHLIDAQREFFTRHELPLPERPDLADPIAAWSAHTAAVRAVLADPEVPARAFDGPFGPTTVGGVLLEFYGFDMVAHTAGIWPPSPIPRTGSVPTNWTRWSGTSPGGDPPCTPRASAVRRYRPRPRRRRSADPGVGGVGTHRIAAAGRSAATAEPPDPE